MLCRRFYQYTDYTCGAEVDLTALFRFLCVTLGLVPSQTHGCLLQAPSTAITVPNTKTYLGPTLVQTTGLFPLLMAAPQHGHLVAHLVMVTCLRQVGFNGIVVGVSVVVVEAPKCCCC